MEHPIRLPRPARRPSTRNPATPAAVPTAILLAALLLLAAGLATAEPAGVPGPNPDDRVTAWVLDAIRDDPRVDASAVEVSTDRGIVTLEGNVPTLASKKYSVLSALKILGVRSVIDRLEIAASPRPDAELAADVQRSLARSAAIQSTDLHVSSQQGTVKLEGEVGSWAQQRQAELLASGVRGVRAIENELTVLPTRTRPDVALRGDVIATLERDVYLTRSRIGVVVEDGVVTLSGAVASAFEKERAATATRWIPDVRQVRNRLRVEWRAGASDRVAPPLPRSDAQLEDTIAAAFRQDDRVDAARVDISVKDGRVVLSGRVAHAYERRILEDDARNVVGVAWVTNQVEVVTESRADRRIEMDVSEAFAIDSTLFETPIDVVVDEGFVTLKGDVPSGYHRNHAGALAARIRGVRGVNNRLRALDVGPVDDDRLAADIVERLSRDAVTGPLAAQISVEVKGGIATLSGTVRRFAERRSAGRIAARTPGVAEVRNHITVEDVPYPWEDHEEEPGVPSWDHYEFDYPHLPWIA
jgi:osmotically-inducible protein OsmY